MTEPEAPPDPATIKNVQILVKQPPELAGCFTPAQEEKGIEISLESPFVWVDIWEGAVHLHAAVPDDHDGGIELTPTEVRTLRDALTLALESGCGASLESYRATLPDARVIGLGFPPA